MIHHTGMVCCKNKHCRIQFTGPMLLQSDNTDGATSLPYKQLQVQRYMCRNVIERIRPARQRLGTPENDIWSKDACGMHTGGRQQATGKSFSQSSCSMLSACCQRIDAVCMPCPTQAVCDANETMLTGFMGPQLALQSPCRSCAGWRACATRYSTVCCSCPHT